MSIRARRSLYALVTILVLTSGIVAFVGIRDGYEFESRAVRRIRGKEPLSMVYILDPDSGREVDRVQSEIRALKFKRWMTASAGAGLHAEGYLAQDGTSVMWCKFYPSWPAMRVPTAEGHITWSDLADGMPKDKAYIAVKVIQPSLYERLVNRVLNMGRWP